MATHDRPTSTARPGFQLPQCPTCGDYQDRSQYPQEYVGFQTVLTCPACGDRFRPTDRATVVGELLEVLTVHRYGDHAADMARVLLAYEHPNRELVGVVDGAERALYCATQSASLYAVRFDSHGLADRTETLAREVTDAEAWLDATAARRFLWTHPRYGVRETTPGESRG